MGRGRPASCVSRIGAVPSAFMTQMSMLPWPTSNAANAIRVPSGDQVGSNSWPAVAVRFTSARVATSIVNRSDVPFSQHRSNTSLVPSGDQDGLASISELVVRRTTPVPSANIR